MSFFFFRFTEGLTGEDIKSLDAPDGEDTAAHGPRGLREASVALFVWESRPSTTLHYTLLSPESPHAQ